MTPQDNGALNFGELSFYSGTTFIPDGQYIAYHNVVMHQATDKTTGQNKGIARLGVMIDFYPLANPTEENKIQQFYSMGTKAAESFAPNPETGKGIVRIPGGGSKGGKGGMFEGTNWSLYLQSLYNSAMP